MALPIAKRIGIPLSTGSLAGSAPIVVGASIMVANRIDIYFNKQISSTLPSTSAFSIVGKTINNITIDATGFIVMVTVSVPFVLSNTPTVVYTQPVTNPLSMASAVVLVASFSQLVSNRLLPAPLISSASGITTDSFFANWQTVTNATGYYLDVSTSNLFTSFLSGYNNLNVGLVLTTNVIGLEENTNYYYRVRAYNSNDTSESSTISTARTAYGLGISKRGDGTGVTSLNLVVSETISLTISGAGKFYSNSGGTLNESVTWSVLPGQTRTVYMKCHIGTGIITFSDSSKVISLGGYGGDWVYGGYNSPTIGGDPFAFPNITYFNFAGGNTFSLDVTRIPLGVTFFAFSGASLVGNISSIPSGMTHFVATDGAALTGDVADLPSSLVEFEVWGTNTITGDIADIPANCWYFVCYGNNTIYGDIADIPSVTTDFYVQGQNTISGDVGDLKEGLLRFDTFGGNTISGNISGLPSSLVRFSCHGYNTIAGSISNIPASITYFSLYGYNTCSGVIADLKSGLQAFSFYGNLGGSLSDLKAGISLLYVVTTASISGNLSSLPSGIGQFVVSGNNTITGNLNSIPSSVYYFILTGQNTVSGYTSGKTWYHGMRCFIFDCTAGYGLNSTQVDNLLIDFSNATWDDMYGTPEIVITGNNAARTSASDAAVAILTGLNITLVLN